MYNLDVTHCINKVHGGFFHVRLMDANGESRWSTYVTRDELPGVLERIATDTNGLWRLPSFAGRNFSELMAAA